MKSNKAPSEEREKGKSPTRNNQETWAKRKSNESLKMKWAKFKRQIQIEDISKHERQPKRFSMKCNP